MDWVIAEFDKALSRLAEQTSVSAAGRSNSIISNSDFRKVRHGVDRGGHRRSGSHDAGNSEVDDAPVVKFLQKMLVDAVNMRAWTCTLSLRGSNYACVSRIDGVLRGNHLAAGDIRKNWPRASGDLAHGHLGETRLPQDGRMKLKGRPDRTIDFPRQHAARCSAGRS